MHNTIHDAFELCNASSSFELLQMVSLRTAFVWCLIFCMCFKYSDLTDATSGWDSSTCVPWQPCLLEGTLQDKISPYACDEDTRVKNESCFLCNGSCWTVQDLLNATTEGFRCERQQEDVQCCTIKQMKNSLPENSVARCANGELFECYDSLLPICDCKQGRSGLRCEEIVPPMSCQCYSACVFDTTVNIPACENAGGEWKQCVTNVTTGIGRFVCICNNTVAENDVPLLNCTDVLENILNSATCDDSVCAERPLQNENTPSYCDEDHRVMNGSCFLCNGTCMTVDDLLNATDFRCERRREDVLCCLIRQMKNNLSDGCVYGGTFECYSEEVHRARGKDPVEPICNCTQGRTGERCEVLVEPSSCHCYSNSLPISTEEIPSCVNLSGVWYQCLTYAETEKGRFDCICKNGKDEPHSTTSDIPPPISAEVSNLCRMKFLLFLTIIPVITYI